MSKYKTRPIGEVFRYYKLKIQVVEGETCNECCFNSCGWCFGYIETTGYCRETDRDDQKNVIFKRIDNL